MKQLSEGLIGAGFLIIKSVCSDYDFLTVQWCYLYSLFVFSEIGFCMASCSYIYIYIYIGIYLSRWRRRGVR